MIMIEGGARRGMRTPARAGRFLAVFAYDAPAFTGAAIGFAPLR